MSKDEAGDLWAVLRRKADEDAVAVRELVPNERVADAIVGFHLQQAVEKWLKALLAMRGVDFPWTHDLGRLVQLLGPETERLPISLDEVIELTDYAAPARYGDPIEREPLDRARALEIVDSIGIWARDVLP